MKNKKLNLCLVLSNSYDPKMPARPAIIEIYERILSQKFGHNIFWICPITLNDNIPERKFGGVTIYTIFLKRSNFFPISIFGHVRYYFKLFLLLNKMITSRQIEIIQVRNDVFSSLIAIIFKKIRKIPFAFQYSFPIWEYPTDTKNHLKNLYHKLEYLVKIHVLHFIYINADIIFPISNTMGQTIIEQGIPERKILVLPMGVNSDLIFRESNGIEIREKFFSDNEVILLYIGTLDKLRQLTVIINAFSLVKRQMSNARLLIVGDGDDYPNLMALVQNLGLKNDVIFTRQIPYTDVPGYIAAADVCLCPVPPLPMYLVSSPTKMFEYMIMKKPIIANCEIPEQEHVIKESGCGILVSFDPEFFAQGIIELLQNPCSAKEMGEKGFEWVIKNRSYEAMALDLEQRYYGLLGPSGGSSSR